MSKKNAWLLGCTCLLFLAAAHAEAQIKSPGAHDKYVAELEPHFVLQWTNEPAWNDEGIGVGFRASIPLIDNGPVTTINNSFGIGFGLDWAHFGGDCDGRFFGPNDDCSANSFWIPIVVQWNFYFSDLISTFPEFGLAVEHSAWDASDWCGRGNDYYCDGDDTDVEPVFWLGVRFHVADRFALTLRLGTPSLLFGASFFL